MIRFATALVLVLTAAAWGAPTKEQSLAAFEKFKQLNGLWGGKSTKGWEARTKYEVIAGGSCVMESESGAHPNEIMVTMFHMDGEHLMLTHYCIAQNQPRMRATEISEDGKTIVFTFVDSTNLASRDKGHMDKAVFRFEDDNRFSTQWTWYQDGKERWMENIEMHRAPAPSTQPAK